MEKRQKSADELAAEHTAELIDAICVRRRTETTDASCIAAKESWDALTETQKRMVSGRNADPEYFGRDTGSPEADDPLNADGIGSRELLAVSFGTSFNESRVLDIGSVEKTLAAAFPDWSVRRAFTSQMILNHIQARDKERIDNMEQALQRAERNGVRTLLVLPTHLMHGTEYDELSAYVQAHRGSFERLAVAEPLLGAAETGCRDMRETAEAAVHAAFRDAGFASAAEAVQCGRALVFMGHGTAHAAAAAYSRLQEQMEQLGYTNVFVGTVEGRPPETEVSAVMEKVRAAGFRRVLLRPLMVVAGDHAGNDMAGEDDGSWKNRFLSSGWFDSVECTVAGIGRIADIRRIYVRHAAEAMEQLK